MATLETMKGVGIGKSIGNSLGSLIFSRLVFFRTLGRTGASSFRGGPGGAFKRYVFCFLFSFSVACSLVLLLRRLFFRSFSFYLCCYFLLLLWFVSLDLYLSLFLSPPLSLLLLFVLPVICVPLFLLVFSWIIFL